MIRQITLIGTIGGSTDQDEATITVAAIDIAFFIDLKKHTRMAQRRGHAGAATVASDSSVAGTNNLWQRRGHACAVSKANEGPQSSKNRLMRLPRY